MLPKTAPLERKAPCLQGRGHSPPIARKKPPPGSCPSSRGSTNFLSGLLMGPLCSPRSAAFGSICREPANIRQGGLPESCQFFFALGALAYVSSGSGAVFGAMHYGRFCKPCPFMSAAALRRSRIAHMSPAKRSYSSLQRFGQSIKERSI
jgi:hypothetical protein